MKKIVIILISLSLMLVACLTGCKTTGSQNTTKSVHFYNDYEEYAQWVKSSALPAVIERICHLSPKETQHIYIELAKETKVLAPCYNGERMPFLRFTEVMLAVPCMGWDHPVSDSRRNDCLYYQSFHRINEETNCTFRFSYIIPSHKEVARQSADIYEYRNATKASSVLDESEEFVVKIDGAETKCAMWWTSKRKRIQFLWEDMYVVEISAPISKEKLMEVLNGLSFEEVSVSVKGE